MSTVNNIKQERLFDNYYARMQTHQLIKQLDLDNNELHQFIGKENQVCMELELDKIMIVIKDI